MFDRQLVSCEQRNSGECPVNYQRFSVDLKPEAMLYLAGGVFGILSSIYIVGWYLEADSNAIWVSLLCMVGGLASLIGGLFYVVGMRHRLIDPKMGLFWQQQRLFGVPCITEKVVRAEVIRYQHELSTGLTYPPSVSSLMLIDTMGAKDLARYAMVSSLTTLVAAGKLDVIALKMERIDLVSKSFDWKRNVVYFRVQGEPRPNMIMGKLEEKIITAIGAWGDFLERDRQSNYEWLADLGWYFVEGEISRETDVSDPVLKLVFEDARNYGIGTVDSTDRVIDFAPEAIEDLYGDFRTVGAIRDGLNLALPEIMGLIESETKSSLSVYRKRFWDRM